MNFSELSLDDLLLEAISYMGFETATPIQQKVIPVILGNRDVIACAQTGTGKTGAYALPILHKLIGRKEHYADTLIIVPTRELAIQIEQQIQGFSYFISSGSIAIYGGGDGADWEQEKRALKRGTDIIIATPGRLLSHLKMGYVRFENVRHLVLDEADRMLDMGFIDDIQAIISHLPAKHQTLMFSATMPNNIRQLAQKILHNPVEISLSVSTPVDAVDQKAYLISGEQKVKLLRNILTERQNYDSILIFTATKRKVADIVTSLSKYGFPSQGISSDLSQDKREEVMGKFRARRIRILVATNIMSRGIDVKEINLVINYDMPHDAEDYVHRIGRTARVNAKGEAITLVTHKEMNKLKKIEQLIGAAVPRIQPPGDIGNLAHTISILLMLICLPFTSFSQSTYTHISNQRIYNFLDELASEKIITLNSTVKPYTRAYIYTKLTGARDNLGQLSSRQKQELEHYLDYYTFGNKPGYLPAKSKLNLFRKSRHSATSLNHLGYFYSDSFFSFSLRPVLGVEYFSNSSGDYTHTYRGLEAFASVGKYVALYADLRDNTVSQILVKPAYFSKEMGGNYKGSVQEGSADFSEMRGGILLSWDFLQVGVVKDHLAWGDNYNGAIIHSGRTPSFPMIKLHISPVKWLDFNYFHAWLVSDVVDSSLTYLLPDGTRRNTFKNKFMAANMFTIIPVKGLNLSFGNSIIYSDRNVNPAFLIPVFFYKSVDHTLASTKIVNQNSQMFVDISVRLLKHTHFFVTAFWDEFSVTRISDPDVHNFYAYKLGGRISNWPVRNISVTGEYFRSVPVTYKHIVPTATYESNSYNLGPWLRDNSEEKFFAVDFKPLPRLYARYSYSNARHGNEYSYIDGNDAVAYPILHDNTWTSVSHSLVCSYEVLTNCHITFEYLYSNTRGYAADGHTAEYYLNMFTPEFFQGRKNTIMFKINVGF